jgi:hypothetical protein
MALGLDSVAFLVELRRRNGLVSWSVKVREVAVNEGIQYKFHIPHRKDIVRSTEFPQRDLVSFVRATRAIFKQAHTASQNSAAEFCAQDFCASVCFCPWYLG